MAVNKGQLHETHCTCSHSLLICIISSLYVTLISAGSFKNRVPGKDKAILLDGAITLGGLFPMHELGIGGEICGAIKEEKGIQRVEAMLYAIDMINDDPDLLPGVKLGTHILDTCLRDTYALEQSLEFIKPYMSSMDGQEYHCSDGSSPRMVLQRRPVAGVIGAAASPVSIMVANMLRLFKIPQISYASTGIELSDKTRFGYFSRVVPRDSFQAQALVDVVIQFGWMYVSTLADEGNYGEKGIAAFEQLAVRSGKICISKSLKIPRDVKPDTFDKILDELVISKARAVVMFVNEDNCRRLINATIAKNLNSTFHFLASDSWGAKVAPVYDQEWAAQGVVTILPQKKVIQEFDEYFLNLNPRNNKRNPWFLEFWESHFQCIYQENPEKRIRHGKLCTGKEKIGKPKYEQEGIVPFVVDSVYAMAHALQDMIRAVCNGQEFCDAMDPPDGRMLLAFIRNVSFIGSTGYEVNFNADGDAKGRYTIYQYQYSQITGTYDYVTIGQWTDDTCPGNGLLIQRKNVPKLSKIHKFSSSDGISLNMRWYYVAPFGQNGLSMDMSLLRWKSENSSVPVSMCAKPCTSGQAKKTEGTDVCCWICINCLDHELPMNDQCVPCANGTFPDESKTECIRLPVEYVSLDSIWAIVCAAFAGFGIVCVACIFGVFIKYNHTPVIMASGRELCYVLMLGMAMCFAMTFVMMSKPTLATCTLLRVGLGLSLSICYAALVTKTNRISRIFNRGLKAMVKRPSYTSPRSQLVICFCLVLVQFVGAVTWVSMDLPDTTHVYPDRRTVILRCRSSNITIALSLMYNMVLVLLCTVYAFKTRKIPENFNEAKYIAFTMYSTCIVWLAFIPIYFGTSKADLMVQITALCMSVNISAYVAMGCLFLPKVYIVIFQPHKNVRQSSKGLSPGSRPFFGCNANALGLNSADATNPTGLAMLIAQGANQMKKHSISATVVTSHKSTSCMDETDRVCESINDLDSNIIEGTELETINL